MDPLWKSLLAPRNVVPDVVDSIFCFTCHGHGHRDVRPCCFTCYGHPVLFHMWDTHEQFSLAISTPTVFLFLSFSTHSCHYRPLVLRMDHTINFGSPLRGPYDSGGTNSNWDLDSISICTEKWEFLDVGDVWDVAFSVATVILVKSSVALRVASVPLKSCCPGIPESRNSAIKVFCPASLRVAPVPPSDVLALANQAFYMSTDRMGFFLSLPPTLYNFGLQGGEDS